MASITIRNLDHNLKQRLRVRVAEHGRSMDESLKRRETRKGMLEQVAAARRIRHFAVSLHGAYLLS